jgi:peptidoglycan hydrolase CwlO-like protein
MATLKDLEKTINDIDRKVNELIVSRSYESKDLEQLDKKVELIEKQITQHSQIIRIQTFIAGASITALITYFFKYL